MHASPRSSASTNLQPARPSANLGGGGEVAAPAPRRKAAPLTRDSLRASQESWVRCDGDNFPRVACRARPNFTDTLASPAREVR